MEKGDIPEMLLENPHSSRGIACRLSGAMGLPMFQGVGTGAVTFTLGPAFFVDDAAAVGNWIGAPAVWRTRDARISGNNSLALSRSSSMSARLRIAEP